jgi:RNA polymerase sigma-70 factor (ECF subfamily)
VTQDEELLWIRRAQQGERAAFAPLVEQYWPRVCRWLHAHLYNGEVAEDLTQEVFLKAWTALPSFEARSTLRPWLFTIARNCLLDHQRSPRSLALARLPENLSTKGPGPMSNLLHEEGRGMLAAACVRLPEHLRTAFLLWTHEQMPYDEIAEVLDITEPTARWRVCKARHLLLEAVGSYFDQKVS